MKLEGRPFRTIWEKDDLVQIIDQRRLPHELVIKDLREVVDFAGAIREMLVRGAPLIGATAAYGLATAARSIPVGADYDARLGEARKLLAGTRPTAVDLFHALERVTTAIDRGSSPTEKAQLALETAREITEESVVYCRQIGEYGLPLIRQISRRKNGGPVNVLTHCNAGWLACIDFGTATAPIYAAHAEGIPIHVWVDETRPRNQGARLTAYELQQEGVPHTVIADNTGGHLMQHGMVDLVLVGSDRTTRTGDVANKIGTYLKALAAYDNQVPFYVALPSTSIDFSLRDGRTGIPIEQRNAREVTHIEGWLDGKWEEVQLSPNASPAANYGFDVTPARLVTGLITERGICGADEAAILSLFPERR